MLKRSDKPEDATHLNPHSYLAPYYKQVGGIWYYWGIFTEAWQVSKNDSFNNLVKIKWLSKL